MERIYPLIFFCYNMLAMVSCFADDLQAGIMSNYNSVVYITFKDPVTGNLMMEKIETARFGHGTPTRIMSDSESGWVVHVRTVENLTNGCTPIVNGLTSEKWIALIERGQCKFTEKIINAVARNASAVVVYNHEDSGQPVTMQHKVEDVVSVFINKAKGNRIAELVDNGTRVMMNITVGAHTSGNYSSINKTSVLFVSISFIVLMIISLAWLVFYYIQRFRYAHAKERLSKRLMNAAKKAITKMPVRTIKNGDIETESDFDQCAVCIESYRASDVIRILPCKHMFHKSCVDPWLIEQRSCPMCKLDILKAYGLQIHGSRESMVNIDMEGASTSIGPSEMIATESGRGDYAGATALEVIRYQPAQVEYHDVPASTLSDGEGSGVHDGDEDEEEVGEAIGLVSGVEKSAASREQNPPTDDSKVSADSSSTVSDTNELDSLMKSHERSSNGSEVTLPSPS